MANQFIELQNAIRQVGQQHEQTRDAFWQTAWDHLAADIPEAAKAQIQSNKLTHNEMQLLSVLSQQSVDVTPYKELQAQVDFSQGLFSRYVNRLAKAGLIEKSKRADNKKAVQLSITKTGRYAADLHDEMHRVEIIAYEKSLAQFKSAEVETTIKVLSALSKKA